MTTARLPKPDHIVIVIFENKDVDQVLGTGAAPLLDDLARTGIDITDAHARSPSQPTELLGVVLGQDARHDGQLLPTAALRADLATQLASVGRTFVGDSEDLPEPGFTGCTGGRYARKHAVRAAFTNVPSGSHCRGRLGRLRTSSCRPSLR